ncbi:hypothetical protein DVH24_000438 [Malus domestica]|uniref:Ubiquitin-like protein ATG12 n=1 Tax=Malus domestica TaxID=3750 RepID=A0A498IZI8_MALDO|nr:hypothetical protein DVH24_000438 [Malus domestica]
MATTESPGAVKKVVVHLRATGDAPILKQSKFKILGTDKFAKVIEFLRRQLHKETLFVYVNSAFSPNPDELVIDLYNNFGFDGKLVVNTKEFILHKQREREFSSIETSEQVEIRDVTFVSSPSISKDVMSKLDSYCYCSSTTFIPYSKVFLSI